MIIKASQRGNGKQLALHLLNLEDNEHMQVHDIRGFVSNDITGAFKEAQAISKGTKCKQFLFSVSLNPPGQETPPTQTFKQTISRIEEKTGLTGQPRVVVFHEKEGRRHAHVVWSRIDAETMTAKNLSHFKLKMRDISRETYLEQGWQMPRGLMNSEARDPRNFSLAEWQQAKRMGHHARDLKQELQECWAVSDSCAAFKAVLEERGMVLARGDRRGYVAVTHDGEVLSLSRYIGQRKKALAQKLGSTDELPSVETAKARFEEEMLSNTKRLLIEAKEQHKRKLAPLVQQRKTLTQQHRQERQRLEMGMRKRWHNETQQRAARLQKGWRGLWQKMTGEHQKTQQKNEWEAWNALKRDKAQRHDLIKAHLSERRSLQDLFTEQRETYKNLRRVLTRDREKSLSFIYRSLEIRKRGDQGRDK